MFAYCWNSPIALFDPNGHAVFRINWLDGSGGEWYTDGTSLAYAFSPAPSIGGGICSGYSSNIIEIPSSSTAGNVIARVIAAAGAGAMIGNCLAPAAYPNKDNDDEEQHPTYIYRWGGTNPGNLTTSQRDVVLYPVTGRGLSFSLEPGPGKNVMTTIEALNATGKVYAVRDGVNHVSVFPIGGTLEDWHKAGSLSEWTKAVKSVVIKWNG